MSILRLQDACVPCPLLLMFTSANCDRLVSLSVVCKVVQQNAGVQTKGRRNILLCVLFKLFGCKTKQETVLKATAVRSPLPVMSLILPCPPLSSVQIQQQQSMGGGWGAVGGGAGDISSTLPYTALPHGASPQRDFAQQSATSKSSCKFSH